MAGRARGPESGDVLDIDTSCVRETDIIMITHTLSGFANTPGDLIVQMSPRIAELPMCHTTRKAGVQLDA